MCPASLYPPVPASREDAKPCKIPAGFDRPSLSFNKFILVIAGGFALLREHQMPLPSPIFLAFLAWQMKQISWLLIVSLLFHSLPFIFLLKFALCLFPSLTVPTSAPRSFTDLLRQLRIWPAVILFLVLVVGFKVVEAH